MEDSPAISSPCISSIFYTNLLRIVSIPPKFSKYLYNILSTSQYFRHAPQQFIPCSTAMVRFKVRLVYIMAAVKIIFFLFFKIYL